ncbi:PREDICTED: protein SIEVE ELEMENT OCCLUSION C-like [Tarenaya hassleriana]|uniref:protein SIEVE ELEMENT OCCLUSION C-like n=1 Tax=Tarenaya hassleriana TaxID=28532 RepID=UPI00053C5265|nr:PREDICTED: protein SIEVE ELEMENT OCCLUSION C-like [Tarenaya hassleriana]
MAMRLAGNDGFWSSLSVLNEDTLMQSLLLGHVPDGRWLDSEMMLQEVENIMHIALENEVSSPPMSSETWNCISGIEVVESVETLPCTISRVSLQMLCQCTGERDIQTRTMAVFDLLRNYRWDVKVVIVLGALAETYGRLCLPKHLSSSDPVAASVAILNWLPFNTSKFSTWLKSLSLLVRAMVDVTKCIIGFERLPVKQANPDNNVVGETASQVYLAAYWVVRSAITCLMQIAYFKQSQQASDSRIAMRELSSLGYRLTSMQISLKEQVEECYEQIEEEIYWKLHNIFTENSEDNQAVLQLLFSLQDDFPLQDFSRQIAITELKDKVILLLLSKPELLPLEQLLFLLQQTYDHRSKVESNRNYDIIWIPIPSSTRWTDEEKGIFKFISNSLPWCSVRRPWLMSSTVVKFMRTEWNYRDGETMMVVLDSNGRIVNMNAMDMVLIWGVRAYPFSISRENELWEEDGWSMQLLLDNIHPAFETWVR